jgi:hypothetical protein
MYTLTVHSMFIHGGTHICVAAGLQAASVTHLTESVYTRTRAPEHDGKRWQRWHRSGARSGSDKMCYDPPIKTANLK